MAPLNKNPKEGPNSAFQSNAHQGMTVVMFCSKGKKKKVNIFLGGASTILQQNKVHEAM